MAILAVYPYARNLQVAVWNGSLSENVTFALTTDVNKIIEDQLLPWLKDFNVTKQDLQFAITSQYWVSDPDFIEQLKASLGIDVYVVESTTASSCPKLAYVTGSPELSRRCEADTFIFQYLVRQEAQQHTLDLAKKQFVVAHLAEEIQLGALRGTNVIDVSTSLDEGPFALYHSGGLPFDSVLDLSLEIQDKQETLNVLHNRGGLAAYLGLQSIEELWQRNDEQAKIISDALVYQISKEIGALATVLGGKIHSIILAGQLTRSEPFVQALKKRIGFIAPISLYPGNQALPALFESAQDILTRE